MKYFKLADFNGGTTYVRYDDDVVEYFDDVTSRWHENDAYFTEIEYNGQGVEITKAECDSATRVP